MAEPANLAFGRYLRILRERRRLSLQEVASLSQTFADNVNKGYISRCENGHQSLAFAKVIPLSRIYEVTSDALLEKMELDMELDRVGAPETDGLDFAELTQAGKDALREGNKWDGYAFLREARNRAAIDTLRPSFKDQEEQIACASMSCGLAAFQLGRYRFALHEYLYVESTGFLGKKFNAVLLGRLTHTYRNLGDSDKARRYAERTVSEAEGCEDLDYLGHAYSDRAIQALFDSDLELATVYYRKAYEVFNDLDFKPAVAQTSNNLAQVYFDLGRHGAARRSIAAAETIMTPLGMRRLHALSRILLGEIEEFEKKDKLAESRWKEAATIGKELNDKVLRFKAEYLLLRQAHRNGNEPVTRSIARRLRRLSNWIPKDTPELKDFEDLVARELTSN